MDNPDTILYELLTVAEWPAQVVNSTSENSNKGSTSFTLSQIKNLLVAIPRSVLTLLPLYPRVHPQIACVKESSAEWKVAHCPNAGGLIAVLQDNSLEIRSARNKYAEVIAKATDLFYCDPLPHWRVLSWFDNGTLLAVGYSNGVVEIFTTTAQSLYIIYPTGYSEGAVYKDANSALVDLIFTQENIDDDKWLCELMCVEHSGNIRSYMISPTDGYQISHSFSFSSYYPHGITALTLHKSTVVVSGTNTYASDPKLSYCGQGHGISLWRRLDEHPFFKLVSTIEESDYEPPNAPLLSKLSFRAPLLPPSTVFKLEVSPCGKHLSALHLSGAVSVWQFPSLRKKKYWQLKDQPETPCVSSKSNYAFKFANLKGSSRANLLPGQPIDMQWWCRCESYPTDTLLFEGEELPDALVLCRNSGALSISSIETFSNLLGDSPEFLSGVSMLCKPDSGLFYSMELERRPSSGRSRTWTASENFEEEEESIDNGGETWQEFSQSNETGEEVAENQQITYLAWFLAFLWNFLFWLTDDDRFQTKSHGLIEDKYRMVIFKSSSPEQLFKTKILNKHYGDAISLAMNYGLDCDLVFEAQWRESGASLNGINDYLSRVKCRPWVLQEVCSVVPSDLNAARALLHYGLKGTGLQLLINLAAGEDMEEWISEASIYDYELEDEKQMHMDVQQELIKMIDWDHLTEEQKFIIKIRQRLIKYLHRLSTYECIIGGRHLSGGTYDPKAYARFRDQSTIAAAQEFAKSGNVDAVAQMFTYHGADTLPHMLAILSNLASTLGSYEYSLLLPKCSLNGDNVYEVVQWSQMQHHNEVDWCENVQLVGGLQAMTSTEEHFDSLCSLYSSPGISPKLRQHLGGSFETSSYSSSPSVQDVSDWYIERAKYLENSCGFVDSAIDLLKMGLERNVPGLVSVFSSMQTLETVVYDVGHTYMNLESLEQLHPTQVISLYMEKKEDFVTIIRDWLIPYLSRCEAITPGSRDALLTEYLVGESKGNLKRCYSIIKSIANTMELLQGSALHLCAIDCVYACTDYTAIDTIANKLLDSLPITNDIHAKEKLATLRLHIWCCDILLKHCGTDKGPTVLPSTVQDLGRTDALRLFTSVALAATKRSPPLSLCEWEELLDDLLTIQEKVISSLRPLDCHKVVCEVLLSSNSRLTIEHSIEFLTGHPTDGEESDDEDLSGQRSLGHRESVRLVIDAAKNYYNTSANFKDSTLELAKVCLDLLQTDNKELATEIQEEKDLITALEILHEFGVDELPLDVRLSTNRLSLVLKALSASGATALQYWWRALQLAQLLRVGGDSKTRRERAVLTLLAQQALKINELDSCYSFCEKLISLPPSDTADEEGPFPWSGEEVTPHSVCAALATHPGYSDLKAKATLLDYAMTHCPAQQLSHILKLRDTVELASLCQQVNVMMDGEASPDGSPAPEMSHDEDSSPLLSGGSKILQGAGTTASSLLQTVSSKQFWSNAVSWLKPLQQVIPEEEGDEGNNSAFIRQGCHAFYEDCVNDCHISNIGYSYQSYAPASAPSPAVDFSLNLLRASMIQASEQLYSQTVQSVPVQSTVLRDLAKAVLPQDLTLGLSILFLLKDPKDMQEVLAELPHSDIAIQSRRYIYSLAIFNTLYPWPKGSTAPVYLHPPSHVVDCTRYLVSRYREYRTDPSNCIGGYRKLDHKGVRLFSGLPKEDTKLASFYEYLLEVEDLIEDYVQGQALHKLDAGVDVERFLSDESYKEDTVLGLCMTTDQKVLDLAIVLAKKYGVSLWEAHMTQLQYLFTSELSTEELRANLESRRVMAALKSRPDAFCQRMSDNVLRVLDGQDHQKLSYYFSLVVECGGDEALSAGEHMAVLASVSEKLPALNYHNLLTDSKDILSELGKVLTADSVGVLAELTEKVPACAVSSSTVYCAYSIQQFVRQKKGCNWDTVYDEVSALFPHLSPSDFHHLLKVVCVSEETFTLIPLKERVNILSKAILFSSSKSDAGFSSCTSQLQQLLSHLNSLDCPSFSALIKGPDLALRRYATMFACSGGESSSIWGKVLVESRDMGVLREVMSLVSEDGDASQPEDVLLSLITSAIEAIGQQQDSDNSLLPPHVTSEEEALVWWNETLSSLCILLAAEIEEGNDLLTEELLFDSAMEAARSETVEVRRRILLLEPFILHCPSMPPAAKDLLLYLQSASLLSGLVTDSIGEEAVSSSSGRRELFERASLTATDGADTRKLLSLLKLWPPFDESVYESVTGNPWELLLTRLIGEAGVLGEGLPHQLIWETVNTAVDKQQLPASSLGHVTLQLLAANQKFWPLASKIALLKHNPRAVEAVLSNYSIAAEDISTEDYDREMFEAFVRRGLVPKLLDGPLYQPCVDYLVECEDNSVIYGVIEQLQHIRPEAASALSQRVSVARPSLNRLPDAFKKVYSRLF